jgi:hypothetical protein
MLQEHEKLQLLYGPIRRKCAEAGNINAFNSGVAANTNQDGSINWTGLIQFLTALMPLILALITALGG